MNHDALRDRLKQSTCFRTYSWSERCGSTQDLARAWLNGTGSNRDPNLGAIFHTDHQEHGRGRQGRVWTDAPGLDLAATWVLPALSLANPVVLAATIPIAVAMAVEPHVTRGLRMKWPNDVYVQDRKLAGILIDALGTKPETFLVGTGINVQCTAFDGDLAETATSLKLLTGTDVDRNALLCELALALDHLVGDLARDKLQPWEQLFRERLGLEGVEVALTTGGATHRGVAKSIGFHGVELMDGTQCPLGAVQTLLPAN